MTATTPFSADELAAIDIARTVRIETRPSADAPSRKTTIWIVVEDGVVYVRSYLGERGRWYRDLLRQPDGVLHIKRQAIPIVARLADDPASIAACSRGLERAYARDPSLASMLRPDVLQTTLILSPRRGDAA